MMLNYNFLILVSFLYLILLTRSSNLICNGDFEAYTVTTDYQGQLYDYVPSNLSCWYNKGGGDIEVKKKTNPVATKVAELTTRTSYSLCQKITLSVIEQYQLTYDLLCPDLIKNLKLSVKLNGVLISTLNITSPFTFASASVTFIPSTSVNQLCFSDTHTNIQLLIFVVGGNIDNVTLIQLTNNSAPPPPPPPSPSVNETTTTNTTLNNSVSNSTINDTIPQATNSSSNSSQISQNITVDNTPNTTLQNTTNTTTVENVSSTIPPLPNFDPGSTPPLPIDLNNLDMNASSIDNFDMSSLEQKVIIVHFKTEVKQIWGQIHFISDLDYQQWIQEYLDTRMRIYFEGEIQNDFNMEKSETGKFNIIVKIKRNYEINAVQFIVPDDLAYMEPYRFEFYVDGKAINFKILTESEAKVIQNVQPLTQLLSQIVSQTHFILSSTFCSYFLLNLLNFWNISLMYHFLQIKTIPAFVKSIYEYSLDLLYNRGSLLTWIITLFKIPEGTFEFQLEKDIPEGMDNFRQGYSWFGIYSLSSLFLKSNFQNIFVIGLSLVKLSLVKLIIFLIGLKFEWIREFKTNLISVFLAEVISLVPFFIISAFTNVTLSFQDQEGRLEKIIQIFTLFIFTFIIFFWLVHQDKIIPSGKIISKDKISTSQTKAPSETKFIKNTNAIGDRAQMYCDINIFCLSISVPILILLQQKQTFFLINFIVIMNSFFYLIRNRKKISSKAFKFLILFVWVIHHLTFFFFYFLEMKKNLFTENVQSRIQVICGIIVLFTVLLGGAIEIIQFVFDIGVIVVKIAKKIINKCKQMIKQDETIYPENQKQIEGSKTIHKNEPKQKQSKTQKNCAISVKDIEYDEEQESYQENSRRNKQGKKTENPNLITIKVYIKKRESRSKKVIQKKFH